MRTEDLTYFQVIAESRSLLAASEKLGISQPTLSKSIARLERALGMPVIERMARGIALTDAGRVFLAHSKSAVLSLRDAMGAVRDLRAGRAGTVRIGLGVGVPQALIAEALKPMIVHDGFSVEIVGGMSDSLSKAVAAGECDFAVTNLAPNEAPSVRWTRLFHDPMIPVVAEDHPLAGERRLDWETLSRQRWVTPGAGTASRRWFEQQFIRRRLPVPTQIISMSDYSYSPEVWADLQAILLRPASLMRVQPPTLRFVELGRPPDWKSDRYVGVMQRRKGHMSPAAERVIARIMDIGRRKFPSAVR
jgi:DNA-binding transcriptional LysR family regulator